MRIVLDTNVLVSAFISRSGDPAALLDIALTLPDIEIILSEEILKEFGEVLSRREVKERFQYTQKDISGFVSVIRGAVSIVALTSNLEVIKEDPDDDIIINTAFDGKADYIVSGDNHLRKLKKFKGIVILTPKIMLDTITRRLGDLIP